MRRMAKAIKSDIDDPGDEFMNLFFFITKLKRKACLAYTVQLV